MDCRTGHEHSGSDHHFSPRCSGLFHGYVSSLLSCCRDHVSGLSGTGHRADPLKLGMAAL